MFDKMIYKAYDDFWIGEWRHTHHILPENDWKPALLYLLQHCFYNQWLASGEVSPNPLNHYYSH